MAGLGVGEAILLGSALAGGAAAASGAFKKPPQPTPAPEVPAVPVMPEPDDAAVAAAKQKSLMQQIARRGRASTILTQSPTSGATTLGDG